VPAPKPKRFAMNYHLLRLDQGARGLEAPPAKPPAKPSAPGPADVRGLRVRVQVWLDDGEAVPSVVEVWPTADWHEREAWDMFGIRAEGHPNLRRILLTDDWEGHPLRKDYPIGGEPVRFSGEE
jgi:NADH:ubiquinone oxidoreductase subunit C